MSRRVLAASLALLAAAPSSAQSVECLRAFAAADALYVDGDFDAVGGRLDPCFDDPVQAVPAYRLLALAQLRQGEIAETKLTILRILTLRPTYRADRIQDPPTFVALVATVRQELAEASPIAVEVARVARGPWDRLGARAPQPPPVRGTSSPAGGDRLIGPVPAVPLRPRPSAPRLLLGAWGGAQSYGGERGVNATSSLGEFTENAGPGAGLDVEVVFRPWLGAYVAAEAGRFPTLVTRKNGPGFDEVGSFSEWVQFGTAGARLRTPRRGPFGATASVGGGAAFGRRNGAVHVGAVLAVAGGLEVALSPANWLFAEGQAAFVGPARAIDGAAQPSEPLDLFSGARLGVRTRLR